MLTVPDPTPKNLGKATVFLLFFIYITEHGILTVPLKSVVNTNFVLNILLWANNITLSFLCRVRRNGLSTSKILFCRFHEGFTFIFR